MQTVCDKCNHAQALHDRWSICGVLGCRTCHIDSKCPRCNHTFGVHTVSDNLVFCGVRACDYLTCYNVARPDTPLMKGSALDAKRKPVERLPWAGNPQPAFADALPSVYRKIKTVQAEVVESGEVEDTSNHIHHTEQGFLDG